MFWLFAAVALVLIALLPPVRKAAATLALVVIAGTLVLIVWNEHDNAQRLAAVEKARAQEVVAEDCNIPCKLAAADALEREERGE